MLKYTKKINGMSVTKYKNFTLPNSEYNFLNINHTQKDLFQIYT